MSDSQNNTPFAGLNAAGQVVLVKTVGFLGLVAGSPQGQIAGQAGSAQVAPDMVWDYLGHVLWVCTQTGPINGVVWTQIQLVTGASFTNLSISGGFTAGAGNVVGLTTTGSLEVQTNADVAGNLTCEGSVTFSGALTVGGAITLNALATLTKGLSVTAGPVTIATQATLTLGAIFPNGVSLQLQNASNVAQNVLTMNSSNNLVINTSLTGSILLERQDGTVLATIGTLGSIITRTGTGTFRSTCNINPEANPFVAVMAAGSANNTMFSTNILTTGSNHALFAVAGTQCGSITSPTGTTTSFNTTSDRRIKDIDSVLASAGAIIDSVPVYWGNIKNHTDIKLAFFIADELQVSAPWAVTGKPNEVAQEDHIGLGHHAGEPILQQVDHSALVSLLWAEVQNLRSVLKEKGILECDGTIMAPSSSPQVTPTASPRVIPEADGNTLAGTSMSSASKGPGIFRSLARRVRFRFSFRPITSIRLTRTLAGQAQHP